MGRQGSGFARLLKDITHDQSLCWEGGCRTMRRHTQAREKPRNHGPSDNREKTPPAGFEPATFGLEVRRLVHQAKGAIRMTSAKSALG